jgi:hypothetical protein
MPDDDLRCSRCGRKCTEEDRVAGISGRVMGDECTDIYYWCAGCSVYTGRLYRDAFCGPESYRDSDPLAKEEGESRVAIIRRCAEPWDARCACSAHREYFGDGLD